MFRARAFSVLALLALPAACDSSAAGPEAGARVAIRFASVPASASASATLNSAGEFTLEGSNGVLTLTDVHFIVDHFELERSDASCDGAGDVSPGADFDGEHHGEDRGDGCEEFRAGPLFVGLDLGGDVPAISQDVSPGTYTKLRFEIENPDAERDDGDASGLPDLMQAIHDAGFDDWPSDASLVVTGIFTPTGEAPRPFTAYFEAELPVKKLFDPPLDVTDEPSTVTVEVDPSLWFRAEGGAVLDLSAYDWATAGKVFEFGNRLDDGFCRMHHEHDD